MYCIAKSCDTWMTSRSEWVNEWMNEWVSEWMKEWMNEWTNELMNLSINQWQYRRHCSCRSRSFYMVLLKKPLPGKFPQKHNETTNLQRKNDVEFVRLQGSGWKPPELGRRWTVLDWCWCPPCQLYLWWKKTRPMQRDLISLDWIF